MLTIDREHCCGCTACSSICTHSAITMEESPMGFMYPSIDSGLCTGCGLCDIVCPINHQPPINDEHFIQQIYACRNINVAEIEKSRSGAIFPLLAELFISYDGVVYGAGFKDHFVVSHKRADDLDQCQDFRGSKYAQSNLNSIYKSVRNDLISGLYVLFSGTPCQIAGLRLYLGKTNTDKLTLVDIVCHGVSSPAVWRDYLSFIEQKTKKRIVYANFRDKKLFGWSGIHKESFVFEDGKKRTFDYVYYNDRIIRPACHTCHYCSTTRFSDITIGDLWGWENICPKSFNSDDKGCSLVMCNTQKGKQVFDKITSKLNFIQTNIVDCMQPNLRTPTPKHIESDSFAQDYLEHGFNYVRKKYGLVGMRYQAVRIVNYIKSKLS